VRLDSYLDFGFGLGEVRLAVDSSKDFQILLVVAPPPGKGMLACDAFYDSERVAAQVEVVGVGTYTTPFTLELSTGTYTLNATYKEMRLTKRATIVEGQTTTVNFNFTPFVTLFPWLLVLGPLIFGTVSVASSKE
jgi:hypothetical protein